MHGGVWYSYPPITPQEGYHVLVYTMVGCLVCQVVIRQVALAILGTDHPKAGLAPRLATKVISVAVNTIATLGGIVGLLYPPPAVQTDPVYGYSSHSQLHFAIAAGYFMWATIISLVYKGSLIAILQNAAQCGITFAALHPFMHHIGHVFLLTQASTLVLDLYSCGRLLVRRKSKYLFLSIIHPLVFLLVRLVIGVPLNLKLISDLSTLLSTHKAHNIWVVCLCILASTLSCVFNMYWFGCMISARHKGSVVSVAHGGETMNVRWFAFNLNWFDVGITLTFGDLRQELTPNTKLKISNSSYRYANPGISIPAGVVGAAVVVARNVTTWEQANWANQVGLEFGSVVLGFILFRMIEASSQFGLVMKNHNAKLETDDSPFTQIPNARRLVENVELRYHNDQKIASGGDVHLLSRVLAQTPLPKGKCGFSSIHVIAPPEEAKEEVAEQLVESLKAGNSAKIKKELHVHRLAKQTFVSDDGRIPAAMDEYNAIFDVSSNLILAKADRASLIIFIGWKDPALDFYAALIGMLPFRGLTTALITQREEYGDLLNYTSPSTVFEVQGSNAARMGMFPIKAVYGHLHDKTLVQTIDEWDPVQISSYIDHEDQDAHPTVHLPFKIGALTLPMLTHNGSYDNSIQALSSLLSSHFPKGYLPVVSCGETCDALGYGQDILEALNQERGYYFTHLSGETYKSPENYGTDELFQKISWAKSNDVAVVIIAVGGGVNGNCIGLIAALTDTHLIEVPTTPMHYNDATTSAKKAFSLVKDKKILSKNIMGAYYIPELVYCISETFLTLSSANAHATIGESCKTMNMLGMTNTQTGATDYYNIQGGKEFASDYTKIVQHVGGFDALVEFIQDPKTCQLKSQIIQIGTRLRTLPKDDPARPQLIEDRHKELQIFRKHYYNLGEKKTTKIKQFLSVVNREIVMAKAMFLAYSDPFEKYRALLFEYAHTLGHGVEAYLNFAYKIAADRGIEVPESAIRLHGQCVGMAVLWAGQMSFDLGELKGSGFALHQGFVYLFNRHGGFDFKPLRQLFDTLNLTKAQFCEGVLEVVRRDNKRGYCGCSDPKKSVDQLVTGRPGKMMRSTDANAELRYLVEVDEDWQERVLGMAYDGLFDKVADIDEEGNMIFVSRSSIPTSKSLTSSSSDVGKFIHNEMRNIYR